MESDSDDEGSSFFGENAEESDSEDEQDAGKREAVFSAQHAERAAHTARSAAAAAPAPADRNIRAAPNEATSSVSAAPAAKPSGGKGFAFSFPQVNAAKPGSRGSPSQPAAESAQKQQPISAAGRPLEQAPQYNMESPGSHAQQAHGAAQKDGGHDAEQWDAMTETDSDDDYGQAGSSNFMSQYAAAMDAELGSFNVGKTFARLPQPSTSTNGTCPFNSSHHCASDNDFLQTGWVPRGLPQINYGGPIDQQHFAALRSLTEVRSAPELSFVMQRALHQLLKAMQMSFSLWTWI